MECSACSHDNPPQARFCLECGQELARACASCREALPPTAKFCMHCGARQEDDAGAVVEATAEVDTAEQRLLTVLFCDLVGSIPLSAKLTKAVRAGRFGRKQFEGAKPSPLSAPSRSARGSTVA